MTHKEWSRKPSAGLARRPRTNSRFWDAGAMLWYNDVERKRTLSAEQVREVNFILKQRARRFIAGLTEDDLFPEKYLRTRMWSKLGGFLMPQGFTTSPQSGYTVIGFKDGSYKFIDEFGRRPQTKAEYDAAVVNAKRDQEVIERVLANHRKKQEGGAD